MSDVTETRGLDDVGPDDRPGERPGDRIAHYKLLQQIGEGGFGTVWMAEQEQPVKRRVALKIIKPGMDSRQVIARFAAERQALAMMDHPGIAKVYDAGTSPSGRPYFAMELVKGVRITDYCDRENLSTRDRLQLFVETCNAVQHAHQKGVIHRDLKPSNVLVTVVDGKPVPKVIDFGVAKATGASLTEHTMFTRIGQFVGTPAYMSPEQAEMTGLDVDTRSDIYALGVLLYELLTGTTPFDSTELQRAGLSEIPRIIREQEPPRPSTRLSRLPRTTSAPDSSAPSLEQVARRRQTDPRSLNRLLRGDLDWIIMKALEKDRTRRYETANGFAADVLRYVGGEPVLAVPPSPAYRVRKFVRRNRGLVSAAVVVAAALVVGVAGTTWGLLSANRQRALVEARAAQLEQVARFQAEQLGGIDVPLMALRLREDLLREARAAAERERVEPATIEARLGELEKLVAGVDFAGISVRALQTNVFERALDAIERQFTDQPLVRARLLQTVAVTVRELGMLDLAVAPQTEALEIRRTMLGDDHPETLESVDSSGGLALAQGRYDDAERLFGEALDGRHRVLGDEHPDTLASIANLGTAVYYEGRYEEAEKYYREALEGRRRVLGDENPQTVASLRTVGWALLAQNRLDEAAEHQLRALEICRRTVGDDDPDTLQSLNALAVVRQWQRKFDEAELLDRQALDGRRRALGDDHPDTLASLSALGADLQQEGKLDEAEPILREALERQSRVLGEDSPSALVTTGRLGVLLYDQERYREAEPYYRRTLDGRRRASGPDHPDSIVALSNLGVLLLKMGRPAEAEASFREALERSRRVAGDEQRNTLTYRFHLGRALAARGKLTEAEAELRQALEGRRRVLGDDHPDTMRSLSELRALLTRMGRQAEAEALSGGESDR